MSECYATIIQASKQIPLIMKDPGILLKMLPDLYLIRPFTSKTSNWAWGFQLLQMAIRLFFGYQFNLSVII